MREIKFRGKHIETGEWVHGYLIGNDVIVGKIVEWDDQYFCTEFWNKVDPETVGQYTGLKDKNGKEIYESDVISFTDIADADTSLPERIGVVDFRNGSFKIRRDVSNHYRWIDYEVEIIGNIHNNPELLK